MTLNHRSKKYLDMTPEQRKEYNEKMCKRPPQTELQKLAQKENFALFQLKGMLGTLRAAEFYFPQTVEDMRKNLNWMIREIKEIQNLRAIQRKSK